MSGVKVFGLKNMGIQKKPRVFDEMINVSIGKECFRLYIDSLSRHCNYKHRLAHEIICDRERLDKLLSSDTWFLMYEYNGNVIYSKIFMLMYEDMLWCLPVNDKGIVTTMFEVNEVEAYKFATFDHIRILKDMSTSLNKDMLDVISNKVDDNIYRQLFDEINKRSGYENIY